MPHKFNFAEIDRRALVLRTHPIKPEALVHLRSP
jgi:hypothetical protein